MPAETRDVPFNLNDHCRFRLTPEGRRVLLDYWKFSTEDAERSCDVCHPGWRDGEVRIQLWRLMDIFGPHILGGHIHFERNEIVLEVPNAR